MTTSVTTSVQSQAPSRLRRRAFLTMTAVTALLLTAALPNLLAPWTGISMNPNLSDPDHARWFNALEGSGDATALALLLVLLWRARQHPLIVAALTIGLVPPLVLVVPFAGPSMMFIMVPVALVALSYPYWSSIRSWRRTDLRPIRPLLALGVVTAAAMVAPIADAVRMQLTSSGNLVTSNEWATYAEHMTGLAIGGLIVSTGLAGWRAMAWLGCAHWAYLGVVAIIVPDQPASWGVWGGVAALTAAVVYGVVAAKHDRGDDRGDRHRPPTAEPEAASHSTPQR